MTPKIRLRNVHKSFGAKLVLDGIDLDIMPGTSMVVIGGSGTGKSVLLREIIKTLQKKHAKSSDAVAVTASTGKPHIRIYLIYRDV